MALVEYAVFVGSFDSLAISSVHFMCFSFFGLILSK